MTMRDWSQFYAPERVAAWQLPAASQNILEKGVFRQLTLSWSELPNKTNEGKDIPLWFLGCDVLKVNQDILIAEKLALVFARRVEITSFASLICDRRKNDTQNIIIFAQEVVDGATGKPASLNIKAVSDNKTIKTHSFQPDPVAQGATGFSWSAKSAEPVVLKPEDLDPAYFYEGAPLRLALVTAFQLATLLSTEDANLSIAQLRWVSSLAKSSPETRDLAAQSASMAMTLLDLQTAAGNNALLVPQLDLDIYAAKAQDFMGLLRERQDKWDKLQSRLADDEHWANAARDAIATQKNQKELAEKLVSQAENTRRQAVDARDIAARQVVAEQEKVERCREAFEHGIEQWKEAHIRAQEMNIVMGVGKMLLQLPAILTVGPIAALPTAVKIAEGVTSVVDSVGSITRFDLGITDLGLSNTDIGASEPSAPEASGADSEPSVKGEEEKKKLQAAEDQLASGLKTAGEGGKEIFDAISNIINITRTASQVGAQSHAILQSVENATSEAFSSYEIKGLDVVTGGSQVWDLLKNTMENTFENINTLKEIDGGTNYRLEIRNLIIYGKAFSEARLAVAKADAQLAEMKWRRIAIEKEIDITERRLKELGQQISQDQTFAQLAFGRILDTKRSIYLAMEAYQRAFQYFTLVGSADVPALPRITDTVDKFGSAVAQISGKELRSKALRQPPESMNVSFNLTDEKLLIQLKSDGFVTWELNSDHQRFKTFCRIRFRRVRIFVEGLDYSEDIEIRIATSGMYTDKLPGGGVRSFLGSTTRRNFVYEGANRSNIAFDGDIAPRYENDFFSPTPFTIWTIRIQPYDRENTAIELDLLKTFLKPIESLKIELYGEATPIS